ncbi:MAG: hypothetical protein HY040_14840 [Planctomycetes bacterium]|nr:hypothetical protein [Planctomycetota bacterium]
MVLVPHRFLFRVAHPCRLVKGMPRPKDDRLLDLPADCRIENFADMDEKTNFADVALAWNELGVGIQLEVRGKANLAQADPLKPRGSDGLTLWLDTRDARASHRASRYCHQFHFLPTGGGDARDEAAFVQTKINRALEDAPMASPQEVALRCHSRKNGYLLEAFLSAAALHGYDPEQHPRLGFYYSIRDDELGEQQLSVGPEFPFWDDPSLWSVLDLTP